MTRSEKVAAIVQRTLAEAFPGTAFAVAIPVRRGKPGGRVEWRDGPTVPQVEAVIEDGDVRCVRQMGEAGDNFLAVFRALPDNEQRALLGIRGGCWKGDGNDGYVAWERFDLRREAVVGEKP